MNARRVTQVTFLLALSVGLAACASRGTARVLQTPAAEAKPAAHVGAIRDYDVAVASIFAILERDLNVPPYRVDFYFFPDRQAFQRGLLGVGYTDALARETARTMDAVGGYRRVLLNEGAMYRQPWPARVASLAHEIAHSLQYELGGGRRGTSDQWLREGFAEWFAMHVLDRLRALGLADARGRYNLIVRRAGRSRAPRIERMVTFPQWVALNSRSTFPAYPYAFLAVDFLIERHGLDAVVHYFRLFARTQDRDSNFRTAFGQDLQTFEAAFRQRLGA